MKTFWSLLLVLLPWQGVAQVVAVRVVDAVTGEPLPYVNVCFERLRDGRRSCTVTRAGGQASALWPDSSLVTCTYVGYRTRQDTLAAGGAREIALQPDLLHLDQVVVTATRTPRTLEQVPVITQVVRRDEVTERGIATVTEVLSQDIPGVEFQRGGFGPDMKMQGLEARNVLILLDGERLAGESGYNVDYSRLNTADIERVEVVKGAASALYGSQAMGGVVNIITRETQRPLEMNAGIRWGTPYERNYPDLQKGDDLYTYKKNLDRINGQVDLTAGMAGKHLRTRTSFIARSADAYLLYDREAVEKKYLNIDTVITEKLNRYPTGIPGYGDWQLDQKITVPVNDSLEIAFRGSWYHHDEYDFVPDKVHQRYLDQTLGGRVRWSLSPKVESEFSCHYDRYSKYDYYEKLSEKSLHYRNTFLDPRVMVRVKTGARHRLTAGTELFDEALFSDRLFRDTLGERGTTTWILFAQDEFDLTGHLNLTVGMRLDRHSAFGAHLSPKLSLMYRLKPLTFRFNYARGFRSPSLKELYIDWHVAWFTIRGDTHLRPETNHYLSGSVEFTRRWADLSVTAYYNHLQNKIDGMWQEGQTVYQYVNVSEARISGVEVMARLRPWRMLSLDGAYSWVHDRRPQDELVSSVSPHSGNVRLAWYLRKKGWNMTATLSTRIIGAKDLVMSDHLVYRGEYVEGFYPIHFDPYAIWRLSVSQYLHYGLRLTAGIDNLFDYTARVVSFNTSMSPGRTFFITMRFEPFLPEGEKRRKNKQDH